MAICDLPSGLAQSGHLLAFLVDCTDIVGFAILSGMYTYPVWLLVAMVTERTIAIINPLKARNLFSIKSNIIESSCIFLLLLVFAVLPVTLDAYQKTGHWHCRIKDEFDVLLIMRSFIHSFIPFIWICV